MLPVIFYLASAGMIVTVSLLGPIAVALLTGETDIALRLGFYLIIGSFIFGACVSAILGRLRRIPRMERLLLLTALWVGLPVAAALPIYDISDLGWVDSLYESFSGLTTSGSTVLGSVEIWPQALLFWRVQLQWIGGYISLLTIILIMAPMGIGGLTVQSSSLTVGADLRANHGRLGTFAFNLLLVYVTMTVLCFLGLFLAGTRAFYAASLAMSAVSTGGFVPFDDSLDTIIGPVAQLVFSLFLVVGATNIFWHRMILKVQVSSLAAHRESYSVIALIGVLALLFAVSAVRLSGAGVAGNATGLVEALLNAASLVSTNGVQSQPGYFTLLPLVLVLFVVLVGGGMYSTSGGIKHFRIGGMFARAWSELDQLVYPSAVHPSKFSTGHFDLVLMKPVWSFFIALVLTIAIGTTIIASTGVSFEESLVVIVANIATAGPVYDAGWGNLEGRAWLPYSDYSDIAKSTLIAVMLLGRIEVIAFIGIFSAEYWRSR